MVLAELMDFVHRSLKRGQFLYLVPLDVAGAFDGVSHWRLVAALEDYGIGVHIRRVIHGWLRNRTFQVSMRTDAGVFKNKVYPISMGVATRRDTISHAMVNVLQ